VCGYDIKLIDEVAIGLLQHRPADRGDPHLQAAAIGGDQGALREGSSLPSQAK